MGDGFFVETKDFVLFGLAICGALLSSTTIGLTYLRNRRRLRVTCRVLYFLEEGNNTPYFDVEAVNAGTRPVTVNSINIKMPNTRYMVPLRYNYDEIQLRVNAKLPVTLADGETAKMVMSLDKVREAPARRNSPAK